MIKKFILILFIAQNIAARTDHASVIHENRETIEVCRREMLRCMTDHTLEAPGLYFYRIPQHLQKYVLALRPTEGGPSLYKLITTDPDLQQDLAMQAIKKTIEIENYLHLNRIHRALGYEPIAPPTRAQKRRASRNLSYSPPTTRSRHSSTSASMNSRSDQGDFFTNESLRQNPL